MKLHGASGGIWASTDYKEMAGLIARDTGATLLPVVTLTTVITKEQVEHWYW